MTVLQAEGIHCESESIQKNKEHRKWNKGKMNFISICIVLKDNYIKQK